MWFNNEFIINYISMTESLALSELKMVIRILSIIQNWVENI